MAKFLTILIIGVTIGLGIAWYFQRSPGSNRLQSAGQKIASSAQSAGNAMQEKLAAMHLSGEDIKQDMAKTGRVIRENAHQAGQAISDATADARITAAIKAKLVRDPDLSAWDISVSTTDGVVTLAGSVSTEEDVGKAVLLAMETVGVRQAISTLLVKPKN